MQPTRRRSRSKSRAIRSKMTKKDCKKLVSETIGRNIRENKFKSRKQAIAVAFSQIKKSHPQCRKFLERKKDGTSSSSSYSYTETYIDDPQKTYQYSSKTINDDKEIKASYKNKVSHYEFDVEKNKKSRPTIQERNKQKKDANDQKIYQSILKQINENFMLKNI
jgi:hypothetical protein